MLVLVIVKCSQAALRTPPFSRPGTVRAASAAMAFHSGESLGTEPRHALSGSGRFAAGQKWSPVSMALPVDHQLPADKGRARCDEATAKPAHAALCKRERAVRASRHMHLSALKAPAPRQCVPTGRC